MSSQFLSELLFKVPSRFFKIPFLGATVKVQKRSLNMRHSAFVKE